MDRAKDNVMAMGIATPASTVETSSSSTFLDYDLPMSAVSRRRCKAGFNLNDILVLRACMDSLEAWNSQLTTQLGQTTAQFDQLKAYMDQHLSTCSPVGSQLHGLEQWLHDQVSMVVS